MSLSSERQAVKTRASGTTAGGLTLSATRIKLGYRPKDAGADNPTTEDFLEKLLTDGPYMIVNRGSRKPSSLSRPYAPPEVWDYTFTAQLWIGVDRNANTDVKDIEDFVTAVCAAIENSTHSVETSFGKPRIDTSRNPAVVLFEIEISAIGG